VSPEFFVNSFCADGDARHADQRGRRRHIPEIPHSVLDELLAALEAAHKDLLQPPASLLDQPEKLARWQKECHSKIKQAVNWHEFHRGKSFQGEDDLVPDEKPQNEQDEDIEEGEEQTTVEKDAESLTIGLIGK
jgi:hypothetical protein